MELQQTNNNNSQEKKKEKLRALVLCCCWSSSRIQSRVLISEKLISFLSAINHFFLCLMFFFTIVAHLVLF